MARGSRPEAAGAIFRTADRKALARHRALAWHLPVIASPEGPLALAPDITIAVQLGDAEPAAREPVPGGRLQVLLMAYAPLDVEPVLDHAGSAHLLVKRDIQRA